jgi:peptidase A4-like protein
MSQWSSPFEWGCRFYRRLQEATAGRLYRGIILYNERLSQDTKTLRNRKRIILLLSAFIGLVLVSFSTLPQAYASKVSKTTSMFGAGYLATVSMPGELTQVTADWNQPALTCQPSLGGAQTEFEGVTITNATFGGFLLATVGVCPSGPGGPGYVAVLVPLGVPTLTVLPLTVTPGDNFSGSLTFSPSTETVTANLADLSTGQSASSALPQPSTPIAFNTAGWVMISGGTPVPGGPPVLNTLAEFGVPITFSHCSATVSGNTSTLSQFSSISRLTMVDSSANTMATASHLASHGSSFMITWISST